MRFTSAAVGMNRTYTQFAVSSASAASSLSAAGHSAAHAAAGFAASQYLVQSITSSAALLARFPASAEVFLPGGKVPAVGDRIVRSDYARTLQQIADEGPETMYTGALARVIDDDMRANGGLITLEDLAAYRVV